jgi:GNAT superfamily N-acetyltransferase
VIRRATAADAEPLARMRLVFRSEAGSLAGDAAAFLSRCAAWMARRLAEESSWRAWVAVEGDAIVATIWLQLIEKLPNPVGEAELHGYVSSLFVVPDSRDQGLGTALLREALADCDKHGVDAVILWPTPRSRPLYERHGFAVRDDLLERRAGSP